MSQPNSTTDLPWCDCPALVLKGFCMGVADVIPGISGGTIAFILGIYERLIAAIKSLDLRFVALLIRFKFRDAFAVAAWKFLGSIITGILLAVLSLSHMIGWLLEHKPVYIYAFFFGLILATIPIIGRIIKKWTLSEIVITVSATVITFFVVSLAPVQTPEALWFIFLSGAIAISAMILPGISGAFILVLLGKYQFILEAINQRDILFLGIFALGIGVGIITFVRILSWLFQKYHDPTIALLTGIVIGSLNKSWPWKETIRFIESRHGKLVPVEQVNFLPAQLDVQVWGAIILMITGFVVALLLNRSPSKPINLHE